MTPEKLISTVLTIAKSQLGVREEQPNHGKVVDQYLKSTGTQPGNPWCAAFVVWCLAQAESELKTKIPILKSASCALLGDWAKQHDCLETKPAPGAIFLRYGPTPTGPRFHHAGFVTQPIDSKSFRSVEGNTNSAGSREGDGVYQRVRKIEKSMRFILWWKVLAAG